MLNIMQPTTNEHLKTKNISVNRQRLSKLLDKDCIYLWLVNLDEMLMQDHWERILSDDERKRAGRLLIPKKKREFTTSRAILRMVLGNYTGILPHAVKFGSQPNGKPFLFGESENENLHFNLSHSAPWIAIAIALNISIGIDIEKERVIEAKNWVINNLFSENDRKLFLKLPDSLKDRNFLDAWTIKEAVLKTDGAGIANSLSVKKMDCLGLGIKENGVFMKVHENPFWLYRFNPSPDYCGIIAAQSAQKHSIIFENPATLFAVENRKPISMLQSGFEIQG